MSHLQKVVVVISHMWPAIRKSTTRTQIWFCRAGIQSTRLHFFKFFFLVTLWLTKNRPIRVLGVNCVIDI